MEGRGLDPRKKRNRGMGGRELNETQQTPFPRKINVSTVFFRQGGGGPFGRVGGKKKPMKHWEEEGLTTKQKAAEGKNFDVGKRKIGSHRGGTQTGRRKNVAGRQNGEPGGTTSSGQGSPTGDKSRGGDTARGKRAKKGGRGGGGQDGTRPS